MERTQLETLLLETQGFKGLKNAAISKAVHYYIKKAKDSLGIDMSFLTYCQIKAATEWVKEHDPNFKNHIANPYLLQSKLSSDDPVINSSFILKLDKATWVFVSGEIVQRKDTSEAALSMYIFGKRSPRYFKKLTKYIQDRQVSGGMMYNISGCSDNNRTWWTCTGSTLTPRPMDTLFFDGNKKEKIINHLDTWISNEEIYKDRGLTFKTGILLYGTKGTGKSSLASAIANYLKCGLITIDITTFQNINISEVVESINADSERYVILLDEIDSIFSSRDDEEASDSQKEKISKMLSFLDSPQSPNNVIFVATTNYKERLDTAMIRKGRFDLAIELGDISKEVAADMCKSFNMSKDQIGMVLSQFGDSINPAELQSAILDTVVKRKDK